MAKTSRLKQKNTKAAAQDLNLLVILEWSAVVLLAVFLLFQMAAIRSL